jgi:hypothetical protein
LVKKYFLFIFIKQGRCHYLLYTKEHCTCAKNKPSVYSAQINTQQYKGLFVGDLAGGHASSVAASTEVISFARSRLARETHY